jgi:hypothetical protein
MESIPTSCPYCGEAVEVLIEEDGGTPQLFVEDCPICCRPWQVRAERSAGGDWEVILRTGDD